MRLPPSAADASISKQQAKKALPYQCKERCDIGGLNAKDRYPT